MLPGRGRGFTAAIAARPRIGPAVRVEKYVDDGPISVKFTLDELLAGPVQSAPRTLGCVPWSLTITARKDVRYGTGDIYVTINCMQPANALANFVAETDLTLRLVPSVPLDRDVTSWTRDRRVTGITFDTQHTERTFGTFTKYNVLVEEAAHFADIDGRYEIEVQLQIKRVSYDPFPKNEFAVDGDVVVIVGNRRFHVHKEYLSIHSAHFNGLFNGAFAEAGRGDVTLEDVYPSDFLHFLQAIYPSSSNVVVQANNVEAIALLADRLVAPALSAKCTEYLCNPETDKVINNCDKLKLADLGNLDLVKLYVMKRLFSLVEVNDIIGSFNWSAPTLELLHRKKSSIQRTFL
ncbi:CRE-BATH-25 protein [Aphelenchoides avenae]|nr:CRE-BATH-25 protein [Aphelenchus avenae]